MRSVNETLALSKVSRFAKPFKTLRTDVSDGNPIYTANGPKVEINLSTPFTWMIQAAGKCRFYASDLLVDIDAIKREVQRAGECIWNGEMYETETGYMGMREMGVDGVTYIASRIDPDGCHKLDMEKFRQFYSALFRVTVEVVEMYGEKRVQVTTEQLEI